ncbi:response regulator transcription factor [Paenibacillus luteus]|uniref:response regulator transcription factor n=1 Tax=Paenibacillus luteus TaxID=2545753 RepID=UPI001144CC02|nr:response regulator transcription factor [Paenibacillus luteus]
MKSNKKILIMESDDHTRDIMQLYITLEGWSLDIASDWNEVLIKTGISKYDLLIIDAPHFLERHGSHVVTVKSFLATPLILLYPTEQQEPILKGFRLGADDCLAKPFTPVELICRIRAIMRRKSPSSYFDMSMKNLYPYKQSQIHVNSAISQVQVGDQFIPFTKREFSLISYMYSHMNKFISRSELLEQVWGNNKVSYERTVDAYIKRVRYKIQNRAEDSFSLIKTVRGSGYCLLAPFTALH